MTNLLQIDVSAGGTSPEQYALALGLVALLGVVLAAAAYRQQFIGLAEDQQRHKRTLLGQREDASPSTLRVDSLAELQGSRAQLRALFDAEAGAVDAADRTSVWDALQQVRGALAVAWRERTESWPKLSLYLLQEAVLVAVLGAVAVQSTGWFAAVFTVDGGPLTLQDVATTVIDTTTTLLETGLDVLTVFPFTDLIYALAITALIEGGTLLYEQWAVTAAVLVLSGVVLAVLDSRVPEDVTTSIVRSRTAAGLVTLAVLVVVWVVGAVPTLVFSSLGYPEGGAIIGFLAALVVVGVVAYEASKRLLARLRRVGRGVDRWDAPTLAYVFVERVSTLAAVVLVPIVAAYAVVAVADGKLVGVVDAFLSGSLEIQIFVVAAILALVSVVALATRAAWPEVRAAVRETLSRRAVRAALFGRAVPVGVVLLSYFVALAFVGDNVVLAAFVGIAAGIVTRLVFELFQRARYRASLIQAEATTASRVLVAAYRFEDASGSPVYYAEVNTVRVAHTDREALVDEVVSVATALFEDGDAEPSIARAFADDVFRYGIVSIEETERKLERTVWEDVVTDLREEGGMRSVEALEADLAEYPESVWEQCLREWRLDGDIRRRNGRYILNR